MRVIAVTVTYENRFGLLVQVVEALRREGVDEIWVADNGSASPSLERLLSLSERVSELRLFSFGQNLGSAGAYFEVLKMAYEGTEDCFFWFLDDDNLPLAGALAALVSEFQTRIQVGLSPVLYSYRGESWEEDRRAVRSGHEKGPTYNAFCGFHYRSLLRRQQELGGGHGEVRFPVVPVRWGPYGGLFTTLENLKKVGLPRRELFVYADDHEFTLRFHTAGIPQYLIYHSQIRDLDESVGEGGGYFSEKTSLAKLFYGLRNTTYLSRQTITKSLEYQINKLLFRTILLLLAIKSFPSNPRLVWSRMNWFRRALGDGQSGKLGKVSDL